MHLTKNYNTDGGDRMVIGGVLEFEQGAEVKNFPGGGGSHGAPAGAGEGSRAAVRKGGQDRRRAYDRYLLPHDP